MTSVRPSVKRTALSPLENCAREAKNWLRTEGSFPWKLRSEVRHGWRCPKQQSSSVGCFSTAPSFPPGRNASAVLLVQQTHRIGRPVSFPNGQAAADGRCDEILSGSHAFPNRFLVRQIGRNRRGHSGGRKVVRGASHPRQAGFYGAPIRASIPQSQRNLSAANDLALLKIKLYSPLTW
jgi:hypothetical protein